MALAVERVATGQTAQKISRANPAWRKDFEATLPDLCEEDIAGSGFAIRNYAVHENLGGAPAFLSLRERLQQRGIKLLLDFAPNHMAPDHPGWTAPGFFCPWHGVESTREQLRRLRRKFIKLRLAAMRSSKASRLIDYRCEGWIAGRRRRRPCCLGKCSHRRT